MESQFDRIARRSYLENLREQSWCSGVRVVDALCRILGYAASLAFIVYGGIKYMENRNWDQLIFVAAGVIICFFTWWTGAISKLCCDVADATILTSYYQRELLEQNKRQLGNKGSRDVGGALFSTS